MKSINQRKQEALEEASDRLYEHWCHLCQRFHSEGRIALDSNRHKIGSGPVQGRHHRPRHLPPPEVLEEP